MGVFVCDCAGSVCVWNACFKDTRFAETNMI